MNAIAIAEGLPSISVTDVSVTCVNMGNFVFGIIVILPSCSGAFVLELLDNKASLIEKCMITKDTGITS